MERENVDPQFDPQALDALLRVKKR